MSYRLLYCLLMGLGIFFVLGWFWFGLHVIPSAPRTPDAIHTVPFDNKGTIVYLTPFETQAPWGCLIAGGIVGLLGEVVRRHCNFNFRRDELD